ncbi:hypothetical protein [Gilvimarinus algae]|uniref:Bacterial surface antigen (D15) domain-containing protein n=1 Tax=Gilvimarinus algae TaxID=3058037 RepID=A0ABT8THS4_9GAMM|nr:hypothetical protein [Gilvimarinus sp. SDUM040014]MDO3381852.1 hypothetical protein [Gilvimarinus sp. SDUM040014]
MLTVKLRWVWLALSMVLLPQLGLADEQGCYQVDYQSSAMARFKGSNKLDTSDIDQLEGRVINNIRYMRIGVFDENNPDENNSLYRFLNKLHINTKEYVIATQILFAEGDTLDPDEIHETERLLRRRGYLTGAFIVPERICEGSVDLVVVTRDSWSFEIEGSFSHSGGDSSSGIGLSDDNILGTGTSFSIGYEQDEERRGIRYSLSTDHILSSRWATRIAYADNSDGENVIFELQRPFFSRHTPWAAGVLYQDVTESEIIRSKGEEVNEYRHETVDQQVYVGHTLHVDRNSTQRLLAGYTIEEDIFSANENTTELGWPENRKASYPWLEYQYLEDRYAVYRNLNQIQRTEDVPLGITFGFRLGYGEAEPTYHGDVIRYIGSYQHIFSVQDHHLLTVNLGVDGRDHLDSADNDSAIWSSKVAYNFMQNYKNRWYGSVSYDAGQDLLQHEELTVGGIVGMRGYPTSYQRGKKRFLATLERRYYSDWHWFNLVRVGAVAFVEAGKAWDGPDGMDNTMLADVGIGLRLSSSKVRVGNVVHLDIATPLVERDGIDEYQILIKAKKQF